MACIESTFRIEDRSEKEIANKRGHENLNARVNMKCFCFKVCVSNDQIVRVWQEWHRNKSDNINISFIKTDKPCENSKVTEQCDSVFTSLNFSRANIVIFASIIYIIPYLIVLVYFAVPVIDTRAYHKAVLWYITLRKLSSMEF